MTEINEINNSLDIFGILDSLWKHKLIIILFTIISITFAWIKITFFTPNTYTANGSIYISSTSEKRSKSDIDASRDLITTYSETLKLRSFLSEVSEKINGKYSWEEIKRMSIITPTNDTELLYVEVTAPNAWDAYIIADSILNLAPIKLSYINEGGSTTVVDEAIFPQAPNSTNILSVIFFSMLIGFAMSAFIIFIIEIRDNKVRGSYDLEKRYNIPVLGVLDKD